MKVITHATNYELVDGTHVKCAAVNGTPKQSQIGNSLRSFPIAELWNSPVRYSVGCLERDGSRAQQAVIGWIHNAIKSGGMNRTSNISALVIS